MRYRKLRTVHRLGRRETGVILQYTGSSDERPAHYHSGGRSGRGGQCGYCSPGLIMNVLALKKEIPHPTEQQMKEYLAGNLCRCTGYQGQYRALMKYFDIEEGQQA